MPKLFLGPDRMTMDGDQDLYGMDYSDSDPSSKGFYDRQQLDGSAYWVPDDMFTKLLDSILKQLKRAGFRIVVAHGHGSSTNHFIQTIPHWKEKYDLECLTCWGSEYGKEGLGLMVDHAAMNETSLVMALRPELVQMEKLPQDLNEWPIEIAGKVPRVHASKELGNKIISLQLERMKDILVQKMIELVN